MNTPSALTPACFTDLARLLEYPTTDVFELFAELCARVQLQCPPEAAEAIGHFAEEVAAIGSDELEERHTRTFSLSPLCVPYIGVQIFGENNFKRGDLIAGLALDLEKHGLDARPELPDHLGNVLRLCGCLSPEELEEMLTWFLSAAVEKMAQQVEHSATPYRHLIRAISLVLIDYHKEMNVHAG